MNAVEIEQAVSELAEQPFDAAEFPYAFLIAFGNKDTTIKRLRTGASNKSDFGGILQTNNIHLKTCAPGDIAATLSALRDSPATTRAKAKFILATDGIDLEAEDLTSGETIACRYTDFPDHFGFFLPLAGISTVKQIRESAFDIRATSRLNRLYVELIKDNPDWGSAEKRHDMNHFMARLIFCFFAEDTDIFVSDNLFTATIDQMANRDGSNTHQVIGEIFRAMNTPIAKRAEAKLPRWVDTFPYVNGGLFSGSTEAPRFSKIAQRYLSHIGSLDWTQINPDIFGSMIQAVADEEERSVLGMHYTSVPNILKVLNPLFLDDLRAELEAAGDNARKLANLRARMAKIRVFDPACGSGNFLVIAYKEMRSIEYEINKRRGEPQRRTDIPLTNYRGIELRDFSAEIARLALIIAEYQCDVTYRGQKEALAEFLPLDAQNWITCGNALRLDWLSILKPTGKVVKFQADDLFMSPLDQAQIDFANEGGETYICGNPPYLGSTWQSIEQKEDLQRIFEGRTKSWKSLDYVAGWFMKAADYGLHTPTVSAFVSTNSICQGQQVPILWPLIFKTGHEIAFAHTSFKWANLASHNAGVTVAIVAISNHAGPVRKLFTLADDGGSVVKEVDNINAYLVATPNVVINKASKPLNGGAEMSFGNKPVDGGHLLLSADEVRALGLTPDQHDRFIRRIYGSAEFIRGLERYCLWITDDDLPDALAIDTIRQRVEGVREMRLNSRDKSANEMASRAHQMREMNIGKQQAIAMPCVSSENRRYLPVGLLDNRATVTNLCFALYDAPLWNMALIASRLHLVWIATVCGKMKTDFRYSNTMGWNTFPVPKLTEKNRADLIAAAENILLAREAHFPATIADLYDPEKMPENLRAAHDLGDEVLERIYIGRRFRNDTERLEKLFEMYTRMTTKGAA
ncbi:Lactate dehydrogenase [Roseovarius sp. EC-HK134]|uniref:class I SAM-dependent DNA methyltransferase n=1 Tax=unclassified Roseovarius TaxID=2614913 RepID=UPI00125BF42A|nr:MULTISPECIES: DNA methyltransferase [unclassified Roseovarius]VVT13306.1 Lactate dehydrogenase [Roseovarius sp. EC-SD190]VVT18430.1 Lactate dehydrogenase [Roseovarius sp. EC-HK134]